MNDRIIIIDGNSLINRAFYAIRHLTNKEGIHTNGIYGFLNMTYGLLDEYNPKYMVVAFDMRGPTFRHLQYEDYKGTRKGMPEELRMQMPILKEILDAMKIPRMELQGYEADDLIGTVAKRFSEAGIEVKVVTGDKDALQLSSEKTTVMITKKGITNMVAYTPEMVMEEFGVSPAQIIDFKGLAGDTSDNIPGIPSVGPKTATKLLQEFNTVEELIQKSEEISNKRIRGLVQEYTEQALLSKKLATIMVDVPIEFDIDEFELGLPHAEPLVELYKKYGFNSMIPKIRSISDVEEEHKEDVTFEFEMTDNIDDCLVFLDGLKSFSFKMMYDKKQVLMDVPVGMAFYADGKGLYFSCIECEEDIVKLKTILENPDIEKIGYEMKREYVQLRKYGVELAGVYFDGFIAMYLLEPARRKYDLSDIAMENLTIPLASEEVILGKGAKKKAFKDIETETLSEYAVRIAGIQSKLKEVLMEKLKENDLVQLFEEVEMPLVEILSDIEFVGFNVDKSVLEELNGLIVEKVDALENDIYEMAGEIFNINSPKQLGVILFEKLELPVIKKTKTGYSTAHDILVKLSKKHPIVESVIEYRAYTKLKSTYIDGLTDVINPETNRIHTSLNQTIAVTGRLSSTEPNLQNIPVRMPMGRKIRKVFVPSKGNILLDADYSQIELRVLAHMSEDDNLKKAFLEDIDVHTLTASQVFEIEIDDVTSLQRSRAKEVNFGIVYGMSDFGLSENLGISRQEAKQYIDNYFAKYPKVKDFMDQKIADCKEAGYVTTILGRKRYIPEINNRNFNLRSAGERTAMNTPIQGSAADIIKLAMIKVYRALKDGDFKSKLILQVHDELIIDVLPEEYEDVKVLLKENMESAMEMNVPMIVDMNEGQSWYETK